MRFRLPSILLIIFLLSSWAQPVSAQDQKSGPVYVVQPGDTLTTIALEFGVSVEDLIQANQITDPNAISAGTELVIPGLEGIQGKLITETIPLGQDLLSISRYRSISVSLLVKLNRLTSPYEVFAGSSLIIPQTDQQTFRKAIPQINKGQSLLELAAAQDLNPWLVAGANQQPDPEQLIPGETLFTSSNEQTPPPNPLSPYITDIQLSPLPLVQGKTVVITVKSQQAVALSGKLNGVNLAFENSGENTYVAIQGVHALAEPGLAPLSLTATLEGGQSLAFEQMMLLQQGYYAKDPPLSVDPETLDPAVTAPEDAQVRSAITPVTPTKYWDGKFHLPVDEPICIKSWYGTRRSYNGGPYSFFHTGLDYGVCASLNIYAAAPGVVVFTGPLTVRGNATIIDHGWGIYTGYWHQKEIQVKVGDRVQAGQLIGQIGGTGRVTGPHLHFEVWANGIQVEPQDWLDRAFP